MPKTPPCLNKATVSSRRMPYVHCNVDKANNGQIDKPPKKMKTQVNTLARGIRRFVSNVMSISPTYLRACMMVQQKLEGFTCDTSCCERTHKTQACEICCKPESVAELVCVLGSGNQWSEHARVRAPIQHFGIVRVIILAQGRQCEFGVNGHESQNFGATVTFAQVRRQICKRHVHGMCLGTRARDVEACQISFICVY